MSNANRNRRSPYDTRDPLSIAWQVIHERVRAMPEFKAAISSAASDVADQLADLTPVDSYQFLKANGGKDKVFFAAFAKYDQEVEGSQIWGNTRFSKKVNTNEINAAIYQELRRRNARCIQDAVTVK